MTIELRLCLLLHVGNPRPDEGNLIACGRSSVRGNRVIECSLLLSAPQRRGQSCWQYAPRDSRVAAFLAMTGTLAQRAETAAPMTIRMNPSTDAGSIQRITATRSFTGSTQVMLPPAPDAKKLSAVALG